MAPFEDAFSAKIPKQGLADDILQRGHQCLLNVLGRHFLVEILGVTENTIHVTFPGKGYPFEGMSANLEFHDEKGYYYYSTHVLTGPSSLESGIILERPRELKRSMHRDAWRVPTDLVAQLSEMAYPHRYEANVVNLSSTGALVQTDAPFDFSTLIVVWISLPSEPTYPIEGEVVHVAEAPPWRRDPPRVLGIRFLDTDFEVEGAISRYILGRLQEIFPPE